jgi:hypothetical protein
MPLACPYHMSPYFIIFPDIFIMPRFGIAILTAATFCYTGCKKSANNNMPPKAPIKIEGFSLYDNLGNPFGRIGAMDSDWLFINPASLSTLEQSFLNLPDTTNAVNTVMTSVMISPFPNPVSNVSAIAVQSADSVKLKLVITDSTGTVLKQLSKKLKGAAVFQIDLSDRNQFPNRKSLRYYYSFSSATVPNYKVGYGDFKVCEYNAGQEPITVCFQ